MSNISYDLWQKVGIWKTISYCSGRDMQKSCYFKQCFFSSNIYEEKAVLNIISLWINLQYIQKKQKILRLNYLGYSKWKGSLLDVTFQMWHFKGEKKIASLHSYLKRSMPETLFGTLTNLLDSVQKQFLVRTLIRQKLVKWFAMQNSWLVSKTNHIFSERYFKKDINPFPATVPFKQTRYFIFSKICEKAPVEEWHFK